MKNLWLVIAVLAVFSGYHPTQAADKTKDLNTYSSIAKDVRLVTLKDKKGAVIGERTELYIKKLNAWFEAEKIGASWKMTAKGNSDSYDRADFCEGGCADDTCP